MTITLSSQGAIVACDDSRAVGRAQSGGTVALGNAPIDGPPGTTHAWLAVDANVTLIGFSWSAEGMGGVTPGGGAGPFGQGEWGCRIMAGGRLR